MAARQYIIYKHTNKINGKVYIGQTCRKPQYRWGQQGKGYKGANHFYHAIQKYGWQNFQHQILYQNLSKQQADQKEIELIAFFKSTNPQYGYNSTKGGENPYIARYTPVICIETNQYYETLAAAAYDYKTSDAHIYEAAKGIRLTAGGQHWIFPEEDSLENRQYKLNQKRRNTNGSNTPIKIKCIETNMIFNSLTEAAAWCNLKTITGISLHLSGKQKTAGKHPVSKVPLTWERIEE